MRNGHSAICQARGKAVVEGGKRLFAKGRKGETIHQGWEGQRKGGSCLSKGGERLFIDS